MNPRYLSLPSGSAGSSSSTNTSAWSTTAWTQVTASSTFGMYVYAVQFQLGFASPLADNTREMIMEVGTGGSGSETIIIQLPLSIRCDTTAYGYFLPPQTVYLPEPVFIVADTRIVVRARDGYTTAVTYNGIKLRYIEDLPPSLTLDSPADTALVTDATPDLAFTGTDPEGTDVRYNVQLGTSRIYKSTVLNGTTQAWSITSNANLQMESYYTMGAWIKHNISSNTGGGIMQVYRQGWGVRLTANYGYLFSWMSDSTGPTHDHGIGGLHFNGDGQWHWAVVTWDGTNHSLWLDGVLDNQSAYTYPAKSLATMYPRIGCGNETGTNIEFFNGEISNAFIVNGTAWNAATIAANMYRDFRDDTNVTAYWQFAGNGNDSTSYGHTLTGISSPTYATYETLNVTSGTDLGFSGTPDGTDPFASGQQVLHTVQSSLSQNTYYWRARGLAGSWSKWSDIRSFTCDPESSPTVALTTSSTGKTSIGSGHYLLINGIGTAGAGRKVTVASAVTVASVSAALRTNKSTNLGLVTCKIYSDSSGSRGTLLHTSMGTVMVTDLSYHWTLFAFPETVSLSAGTYWLQLEGTKNPSNIGVADAIFVANTASGYSGGGYTVDSAGTVSYTDDDFSIYAACVYDAGTDTTPVVDFTGTDAQSDDIRYRLQVFNYFPRD